MCAPLFFFLFLWYDPEERRRVPPEGISERFLRREGIRMMDLIVKHDELSAEEFILLWESVWGNGPSVEQTRLALEHTLFRVSVYDGGTIIAMARVIGDMGLDYYIKDVVVRPEYQGRGVGRLLISEIMSFISANGVPGTDIFVELCAMPDKIPFYEKFGFSANEAQRLRKYVKVPERPAGESFGQEEAG